MPGEMHVRFKVNLSSEVFKPGTGTDRGYEMGIKLKIFDHEGAVEWMYEAQGGPYDNHMPVHRGYCMPLEQDPTKLQLNGLNGQPVAIFSDFGDLQNITPNTSGMAKFFRSGSTATTTSSMVLDRNQGTWTVMDNNFKDPEPNYVFSKWKWDTGGGIEFTFGAGGGGGIIKLKDPAGHQVSFAYAGGGVGLTLPFDKIAKLAKYAKYLMLAQKGSLSGSTFDMYNAGVILKNPYFAFSELKRMDFLGPCMWIDASVAVACFGKGICAMAVGLRPVISFDALMLMRGDMAGLAAGAACFGGVLSPTNF
jgi:hypothetical protein